MTVSSTQNRVSYTGNGVTTAFAFPYRFLTNADLVVYENEVLQVITTDYTVIGAGDDAGGTVTFVSAPANGLEIVILRDPAITQELDLVENDSLPAESVEDAFDRLTMIAQRLDDRIDRSFVLSDAAIAAADLTIPIPVADEVLKWNAAGDALESASIADIGGLSLPVAISQGGTGATDAATALSNLGALSAGAVTSSGLTMATAKMLGRSTASTGAIEEISVGTGLTLSGGTLSSSASAVQIQPISASVGSNALTISASALSLDFRSATLGSGAVTKVSGTPSNLVISSGSTLGTVSGQQSDIAVLAINNAGTIELAAVNIAGGVNLDETGVISTTAEGGAGAADSATTVYSTTARTNVAYRVIGVIRSTQTTAGTWAAAPSLIQGAGGNALTAMQSVGYGQTWQDVIGSRSANTTYYNTTGKPIMVSVSTLYATTVSSIVVGGVTVSRTVSNGTSPYGSAMTIVPPGASYSFSSGGSASAWAELR